VLLCGVPCDFRLDYGQVIGPDAVYIGVNRSTHDLMLNRKPKLAINGDACKFLLKLSEVVGEDLAQNWSEWLGHLQEKDAERENHIQQEKEKKTENVSPIHVCSELESAAAKNAIYVADGGDFVGTAAYILRPRAPLSWMDPGPFGTLGVGAGFALGAKLCRPESEVWIIYGDGAVGFSIAEFDTFVRHNIPVIAVVGNDGCWTQILREQVEIFKGEDVACRLNYSNYENVVKGFGAEGILVRRPDEVVPAFQRAKEIAEKEQKPVLVNIVMKEKTDFRTGSLSM